MIARALITFFCLGGLLLPPTTATAGPIDFLKRLGHSISRANRNQHLSHRNSRRASKHNKGGVEPVAVASGDNAGGRTTSNAKRTAPSAVASLPFGVPVPNKPGYVTSPYSTDGGLVDVNGYAAGRLVKDPYTGKVFRVP